MAAITKKRVNFLKDYELIVHAKELYEWETTEDLLWYIIEDCEDWRLLPMYEVFLWGDWLEEEPFDRIYEYYYSNELASLTISFLYFISKYINMSERKRRKRCKRLFNKVREFLDFARAY